MIGKRIGNYRVVRQIGKGGMGAVYEAVHDDIGKRVAIKVLHGRFSQDPQVVARFFNEARALTSINHPGIVQIFDFGEIDGRTRYIAMEYLEGESLSARLSRLGRLQVPDAMRLCRQVASALAAAHAQRVIHRDLKPGNVIIVPDPEAAAAERAKVFDFGIAKILDETVFEAGGEADMRTRADMLMGTPTYMSPEQCRGAGLVDERTDVYALGIVLYQMLSGRPPFTGEGDGDILAKHIHESPRPLSEVDSTLPPGLSWLVSRMLSKQGQERPTMLQVVQELESLGSKATGAITAVNLAAIYSAQPLAPPTVLSGSGSLQGQVGSTTGHQLGEKIAERRGGRKGPPMALWILAVAGVLLPLGILLKRRMGQQVMFVQDERAMSRSGAQGLSPEDVGFSKMPEGLTIRERPDGAEEKGPRGVEAEAHPKKGEKGKVADKEPGRFADKTAPEKGPADKVPEKTVDKAADKGPDKQAQAKPDGGSPRSPDMAARQVALAKTQVGQSNGPPPGPAPVPPTEKPKNVLAALVRKDKTYGALPQLPPVVRSQFRGTGAIAPSYRICVDRQGKVSDVIPMGRHLTGVDESIVPTLRGWTYRPQPVPICFVENFSFEIE